LAAFCTGTDEVDRSIDRVVWYGGWADKLAQVVGSANPVSGPYFNFTVPEPTGVTGILAPEPPLLGLVSRLAPVIVGGNTAVLIASESHPLVSIELAECLATADVPPGVVNIITGLRRELGPDVLRSARAVHQNRLDRQLVELHAGLRRLVHFGEASRAGEEVIVGVLVLVHRVLRVTREQVVDPQLGGVRVCGVLGHAH